MACYRDSFTLLYLLSLNEAAISERVIASDNDDQMRAGSQSLLIIPVLLLDASDIILDGTRFPLYSLAFPPHI
jgi:hypothetical protein